MACYHPLVAWRLDGGIDRSKEVNGRVPWPLTFSRSKGVPGTELKIPCGNCVGCRLAYSRRWATRCVHEASCHSANCFITLTFNNENLPATGSIDVRDVQLFIKRLRKDISPLKIRYAACGEYGTLLSRPHYHLLIFGYDFPDKRPFQKHKGNIYFRSAQLERLWPFGYSSIGSLTFESAAYTARYIMKKQKGVDYDNKVYYDGRRPEFFVCSRRPGLGLFWIAKYHRQVAENGFIVIRNGVRVGVPRYYLDFLLMNYPDEYAIFEKNRKRLIHNFKLQLIEKGAMIYEDEILQNIKAESLIRSFNSGFTDFEGMIQRGGKGD
jgi:hypothetical protein